MSERADHAKSIFLEAIEKHAPEQWPSYLDEACGGDQALRADVEKLLNAQVSIGSFHERPRPQLGATIDQPAPERPGNVIGPYKLFEQIGEGGMGDVWMAEQSEPIQRRVAVKVIKAGMDSKQVLARFDAERQALALMDHPNIAKVLDAGATTTGRPYFVMELVKGTPITRFCDEKKLNVRERLELFGDVCRAVQHAHQKGIIHRDIKPSNVLVAPYDGKPIVKVIDFGVAKATGQKLTDATLFTGFGAVVGTPEYMSPEQAEVNNQDIDTRSDIYSLGVLLFELLTGSTPLTRKRVKDAAFLEVLRVIREEESPKPSTRLSSTEELPSISAQRHTEPAKLTKLVRGELDWIVMKALEKDRNRRYETANGFAMDVQRYLADEAVQACPPSVGYRLRKFARRNKRGLVMASVICLACLSAVGTLGWVASDRAARRTRTASEVNQFLERADSLYGDNKLPEAVAEVQKARGVLEASSGDEELKQQVSRWLTNLDTATKLEEIRLESYAPEDRNRAIADYAQVFRDYGIDVEALPAEKVTARIGRSKIKFDLVLALGHWAGQLRLDPGSQDPARWQRLVAISEAADPDPWRLRLVRAVEAKDLQTLRELANGADPARMRTRTLAYLGESIRAAGDTEAAVAFLRNAQRQHPGDFLINSNLAYCLNESKPPALDEALAFGRAALAARPQSASAHARLGYTLQKRDRTAEAIAELREAIRLKPEYSNAHTYLGYALRDQKKWDEAIACHKTAIAIDPNSAYAHTSLGDILSDQKKLEEAVAWYKKAIALDPKYARANNNLGLALYAQGKLDDAIAAYRKAIDFEPKGAWAHINLGTALKDQGKLDEAIACCMKAIAIDPKDANAHNLLGVALNAQGKPDEAMSAYRKTIELDPKHAWAHCNLGLILYDQQKLDEAIAEFRKAIEFDPKHAAAHNSLGIAYSNKRLTDEAIAEYREAIRLEPNSPFAHHNLGNVLRDQNKLDEAAVAYRKVIEVSPNYAMAHYWLVSVLQRQNKLDEAVAYYRKAIEVNSKVAWPHYNLGIVLQRQNKLDEAAAACRKAIEVSPKDAMAHDQLINVLQRQNKLDEAVAYYRKAIEIDGKDAMSHYYLGRTLFGQKKPGEAVIYYRKAIEIDSKHADAYFYLGRAVTTMGQSEEAAIMWYSKAIDLKPNNQWFWVVRGGVHKRLGQVHRAIDHYSEIMRLDPFSGYGLAARNNRIKAYESLQQWDKAIADYTWFLDGTPDWAEMNNGLAWLFATCPDPKFRNAARAVELGKKAVGRSPNSGECWNTLGVAHYRAGDWKPAITALEKSMEIRKGGDSNDWFFLAMAHWRQCSKGEARKWYDQAVEWMDKNKTENEELRRFRAEAEELMGVAGAIEPAPPPRMKK